MSSKASQYSKMVVISALALPLILSLFSLSTPAKALVSIQKRSNGVGAEAAWPALDFIVLKDNSGAGIFFESNFPFCLGGGNFSPNLFQVNPQLSTATLSPVTFPIVCVPLGPVRGEATIQATWTASGPPDPSYLIQHTVSFKGVEVIFQSGTLIKPATATGIFDGQNLGQSDSSFGPNNIFKFSGLSILTCPSPTAAGHTGECPQ